MIGESTGTAAEAVGEIRTADGGALTVRTDHPGGNGHVLEISDDVVRLAPDQRDSSRRWFAWNVAIESGDARTLRVEFPEDEVVGPRGPAVRTDGGEWRWLGADARLDETAFEYEFESGERAQFALSFPYQRADLDAFLGTSDSRPKLSIERLTTTDRGRDVPVVRLGPRDPTAHVLLAARHHACESTASYVLEGALRGVLEDDLLSDHRVTAYPLVDVDGVERGDPGKHRAPHDHNRDYVGENAITECEPLYASTAAIMDDVRSLEAPIALAVDLHCPYKWGGMHDRPFFTADPDDPEEALAALAAALESVTTANERRLTFDATPDVGLASFDGQSGLRHTFQRFCSQEGGESGVSATLEVPFVGTEDDPVTPASARRFGGDLALAIDRWRRDRDCCR